MRRALIFGASGALGSAVVHRLREDGWAVEAVSRRADPSSRAIVREDGRVEGIEGAFDGIVWAQGANATGGVDVASDADYARLLDANILFIARTLRWLTKSDTLAAGARSVVISSIWQITARANKAAYVTSKAALAGFVPAAAADLAGRLAVNAVLPGVIDTPMTRANLSADQLEAIRRETPGGMLAGPEDVASAVAWLLDQRSRGINGQSVTVDNGFAAVRHV